MVLFQGKTNNKSFTDWFENNQMAQKKKQLKVREYRRENQKWTIQKKQNTNTPICVGHYYMHANTNNVNKTTGGKDEPNIVLRGNRNSTQTIHQPDY